MRLLYNARQKIDKFVLGIQKFILTKNTEVYFNKDKLQSLVPATYPLARYIVKTLNRICEDRRAFKLNQTRGRQDIPEIFTFLKAKLHVCCQDESWIYDLNVWWVSNVGVLMDGMHFCVTQVSGNIIFNK